MPRVKDRTRKKQQTRDPEQEFIRFKSDSLRTAKDLCYSKEILQSIKDAQTENEIIRALIKGRKGL